jgi:hypothetical protein
MTSETLRDAAFDFMPWVGHRDVLPKGRHCWSTIATYVIRLIDSSWVQPPGSVQ